MDAMPEGLAVADTPLPCAVMGVFVDERGLAEEIGLAWAGRRLLERVWKNYRSGRWPRLPSREHGLRVTRLRPLTVVEENEKGAPERKLRAPSGPKSAGCRASAR